MIDRKGNKHSIVTAVEGGLMIVTSILPEIETYRLCGS